MEPVSEELSCKFKNMAIVCAILVVFIHIPLGRLESGSVLWVFDMLVRWGIAQIAVPFFFVASGYFLAGHIGEDGWWKREILKRIRALHPLERHLYPLWNDPCDGCRPRGASGVRNEFCVCEEPGLLSAGVRPADTSAFGVNVVHPHAPAAHPCFACDCVGVEAVPAGVYP